MYIKKGAALYEWDVPGARRSAMPTSDLRIKF